MPRATPALPLRPSLRALLAGLLLAGAAGGAHAGEWPQVLGPDRSGRAAADERIASVWPESGPPVEWRRGVGSGYSGVAVADGRVYLFHRKGKEEVLEALDVASGETLWTDSHATTFRPQVGGGDGPLCVPVVHRGVVVTHGAQGVLTANDAATGQRRWQRLTHADFAAQEGYFGAGSTPLIAAGHVIVNVGGTSVDGRKGDAGVVAFRLDDGGTAWTATSEPASYASPVALEVGGEPRVLMVTRYRCLLLDPANGTVAWEFPFGMRGPTVNAATPVLADAGHLLVSASYGIGSVFASFADDAATPIWSGTDSLATQYCTPVVVGRHAYCIDGREDGPPGDLKCIDLATGKVAWQQKGVGYGTLIAADGRLVVVLNSGEILLVEASPKACRILSRAKPLGGAVRALPALAGGRLLIRDDTTLVCLDLSAR